MGYETSYSLTEITGLDHLINEFWDEGGEYAISALQKNGDTNDSCTWYQHERDLIRFSRKHPDAVFELSGEGSDSGDIWKKYFHNGKMQECRAVITYESFDKSKLE